MDPTITAIQVPIHLACSHDIARPGFESKRVGHFSDGTAWEEFASFSTDDLTVVGERLRLLSMTRLTAGVHMLRVEFVDPQTEESAMGFVQHAADAMTARIASRVQDAWYGNLYVEIRWGGFTDVTQRANSGIAFSASTGLTSQEGVLFNRASLESLRWHPLTDIFAEGIRAPEPKAKLLFWFVMLEELEKRKEFAALSHRLFTKQQSKDVAAAAAALLDDVALARLKNFLADPRTTVEGRPQKLRDILLSIGCASVTCVGQTHTIDEDVCRQLIKQRNEVAHMGQKIDADLLYMVLFPLAKAALAYIIAQGG